MNHPKNMLGVIAAEVELPKEAQDIRQPDG